MSLDITIDNKQTYNLYLKNVNININELEQFYIERGFNVKIDLNKTEETIIYQIVDNDKKTIINIVEHNFNNICKNILMNRYEPSSMIYYYLENMDKYYSANINNYEEEILLIYLFASYCSNKTTVIFEAEEILLGNEIESKINGMLYAQYAINSDELDSTNEIYNFINEKFKVPLNEVKIIFERIVKELDELENCIYIKLFDGGETAILNTLTKEYLMSVYPIKLEELIEFYKQGKRNNEIDKFLKKRIAEEKTKKLKEKIEKDGVDYELIDKILYAESYNSAKKMVGLIKEEKTLLVLTTNYNWDDGFELPKEILKNNKCSIGIAALLFDMAEGWEYYYNKQINSNNEEYKEFIINLYNDLDNGKYDIGELIVNLNVDKNNAILNLKAIVEAVWKLSEQYEKR